MSKIYNSSFVIYNPPEYFTTPSGKLRKLRTEFTSPIVAKSTTTTATATATGTATTTIFLKVIYYLHTAPKNG